MRMLIRGRFAKIALTALVVMFIFSGFLGVAHWGMDMQIEGVKGLCPFMPGVVICNMTPLQHMAAAQSLFNALPQQNDITALLMLLLATAILAHLLFGKQWAPSPSTLSHRFSTRREYVPLALALQEAFADGIVHSKAF